MFVNWNLKLKTMNRFLAPGPCKIDGRATGKILEVKMVVKMKLKVTTALIASLLLISIISIITPVKAADPNRILMIDIMAKGDDIDIPGATSSIIAKIEYDKVSGELLGQVEFHSKIYDESGEKVYSMKGKLKNAAVMIIPAWYCVVRDVWWTNLWYVAGEGILKTTDTIIEIEYRGGIITLPNTEGKYVTTNLAMMVSQNGEFIGGVWEEGGWAFAGIAGFVGGIAYLTKYMEKWVP